jgi:hypothetical protein
VYPSIGTLIGTGQKNSLNFIFSEYLVLQQISSFFIKLEQNMAGGIYNFAAYYFIAFYFIYYAYMWYQSQPLCQFVQLLVLVILIG